MIVMMIMIVQVIGLKSRVSMIGNLVVVVAILKGLVNSLMTVPCRIKIPRPRLKLDLRDKQSYKRRGSRGDEARITKGKLKVMGIGM